MGSSGKKKTTMAKMARENKLRERRLDKQAKKDARRQAANDPPDGLDGTSPAVEDVTLPAVEDVTLPAVEDPGATAATDVRADGQDDEARSTYADVGPEPTDPRAKEVALTRLRESPDEELAVFEHQLREDARDAGANEQEMREAQRDHPGHEAG